MEISGNFSGAAARTGYDPGRRTMRCGKKGDRLHIFMERPKMDSGVACLPFAESKTRLPLLGTQIGLDMGPIDDLASIDPVLDDPLLDEEIPYLLDHLLGAAPG